MSSAYTPLGSVPASTQSTGLKENRYTFKESKMPSTAKQSIAVYRLITFTLIAHEIVQDVVQLKK